MNKDDFKFLVGYAIKAPSGHNTQPWKFEQVGDSIIIHPDFSRALPIVETITTLYTLAWVAPWKTY